MEVWNNVGLTSKEQKEFYRREERMLHSKAEMETLLEGVQLWIFGWQSGLLGFLCQQSSLWIRPLKFWEKPARGVPKEPIHWEMEPSVIILWSCSKAHLPLRRSQGCWLPWTSIEAVSWSSLLGGAYKYQGNKLLPPLLSLWASYWQSSALQRLAKEKSRVHLHYCKAKGSQLITGTEPKEFAHQAFGGSRDWKDALC